MTCRRPTRSPRSSIRDVVAPVVVLLLSSLLSQRSLRCQHLSWADADFSPLCTTTVADSRHPFGTVGKGYYSPPFFHQCQATPPAAQPRTQGVRTNVARAMFNRTQVRGDGSSERTCAVQFGSLLRGLNWSNSVSVLSSVQGYFGSFQNLCLDIPEPSFVFSLTTLELN